MDINQGKLAAASGATGDVRGDEAIRQPGQRAPELTRRAILESATLEFANQGFAGASVNEIAARANVNKRMLYHYFGKKDDLYLAVLERSFARLRAAQTKIDVNGMPPREAIGSVIAFTWDYLLAHPEALRLFSSENLARGSHLRRSESIPNLHGPVISMLEEVLRRGEEDGVFRPGVDPFQLCLTISSLTYFYLSARFTLSAIYDRDLTSPASVADRLQHITDVVLGYLRP
jgi:AcrR family transcriptional regulator